MKVIPLVSLSQVPVDTELFIYGSGRLGRVLRRALELAGTAVTGFIDSQKSGDVEGIRRFSLDEFREIATNDATLIIASIYIEDILPLAQTLPFDHCFDARPLVDFVGDIDQTVGDETVAELVKLGIAKNLTGHRVVSETGLAPAAPTPGEVSALARALEPVLRPLITGFVGGDHLTAALRKLIAAIGEDIA